MKTGMSTSVDGDSPDMSEGTSVDPIVAQPLGERAPMESKK